MPSPANIPPWRATLLAIPPDRRSPSQRDLVRGLELTEYIKEELKTPFIASLDEPRALNLLLAGVEAFLLGPLLLTAIHTMDFQSQTKYFEYVFNLHDLAMVTEQPLTPIEALVAVLAFSQYSLEHSTFKGEKSSIKGSLDIFESALEALDWDFVEETLAAADTTLTPAALDQIIDHVFAEFRIFGDANYDAVDFAVNEIIIPTALEEVPSPFSVASLYNLYFPIFNAFMGDTGPPETVWGVSLDSEEGRALGSMLLNAYRAVVTLMERAVAAAEAAGDDGRLALAAGDLANVKSLVSMEFVKNRHIKALAAKATAALTRARPWLPRTHRKGMDLSRIIQKSATVPNNLTLACSAYFNATGRVIEHAPLTKNPPVTKSTPRTYGGCGAVSHELLKCNGCGSSFYCGSRCQKQHWRAGHKLECAELKAQAQAAAAAKAAAAAAAAGPSTPAAGPSSNNKKKRSKKSKK